VKKAKNWCRGKARPKKGEERDPSPSKREKPAYGFGREFNRRRKDHSKPTEKGRKRTEKIVNLGKGKQALLSTRGTKKNRPGDEGANQERKLGNTG